MDEMSANALGNRQSLSARESYRRAYHAMTDAELRALLARRCELAETYEAAYRGRGDPVVGSVCQAINRSMAAIREEMARRKRCEGCGVNWADPPSKLCSGCQAYRDHQA